MAKDVPAESVSEGASRIVNAIWPKYGNNTEARRNEDIDKSPTTQPGGIRGNTKTDREIDAAEDGRSK
jgi:hypothetical protein